MVSYQKQVAKKYQEFLIKINCLSCPFLLCKSFKRGNIMKIFILFAVLVFQISFSYGGGSGANNGGPSSFYKVSEYESGKEIYSEVLELAEVQSFIKGLEPSEVLFEGNDGGGGPDMVLQGVGGGGGGSGPPSSVYLIEALNGFGGGGGPLHLSTEGVNGGGGPSN
jgi:hypothetical protein